MTRDREIERVLERWFSEGPTRMPDHVFTTVVDRIDRVPQRRLAALVTRFMTMPSAIRLTAIAATVVIAAGAIVGLTFLGAPRGDVGTTPISSQSPAPSASPSGVAQPIRDGTYAQAPMQVSDLKAMINADAKLSAADKKFLIEDAFAMKSGKTFIVSLQFDRGRFTELQSVDGRTDVGTRGTYTFPDDHTMVLQEECTCPPMTLRVTASGDTFSLQIVNPPSAEVDAIPVRVLFEQGPYTRQ
jgi:hypothetical protein